MQDFIQADSIVPYELSVKLQAFDYMDGLEGWCPQEKASILIQYILKEELKTIVEIGVFQGKSLIPMAYAIQQNGDGQAFGIDAWDEQVSIQEIQDPKNRTYWAFIPYEEIYLGLLEKIKEFDLEETITLIRSSSESAPLIDSIDLLHIDGNHSENASYFDVTKWVPYVRLGGLIVFNDINWVENGVNTTCKAVEWLNRNCEKIEVHKTGSLIWGIWRKK